MKVCVVKTFRFSPEFVEDMERIIYFTREGGEAKYRSMTSLIVSAVTDIIRAERRELEEAGIIWEHLRPNFKESLNEE